MYPWWLPKQVRTKYAYRVGHLLTLLLQTGFFGRRVGVILVVAPPTSLSLTTVAPSLSQCATFSCQMVERTATTLPFQSDIISSERDEVHKDIETMCLQRAGVSGSIDISTRMQARRAARVLEQELDSCEAKVMLLTRENHNLQE